MSNLSQTYGTEFITASTKENYTGYYHIEESGYYSGIVPDPLAEKLLKLTENNSVETTSFDSSGIVSLDQLSPLKSIKIDLYYPVITNEDNTNGYITRYFIKHKLNYPYNIAEINKTTYDLVNSEETLPYILYETVELDWVISDLGGQVDIAKVNYATLLRMNESFKGISKYFINLKEFSNI